ncbi:MAG: InlB B-repeat-containing protein, partial [Clostridia bacterium]|nr:InlB B-repeat-containing protein [Clostridia bacterium]
YTLTYNANGGNNAPAAQSGNGRITLSAVKPARSGYIFKGWAQSSSASSAQYQPGETYILAANTVLYAVWEKEEVRPVPATRIAIKGSRNEFDYRSTITFEAQVTDGAGKDIVWYVNGNRVASGAKYTAENVEKSFSIRCETIDANGNTVSSETLSISIKTDFFSILIAFFRGIFGMLPKVSR